jgi:hypothetical protein
MVTFPNVLQDCRRRSIQNLNDDLPGTLYDGWNLIIIYKQQFQVVSIGESNFSDHGANRLGASALMQGLADGYFVLPIL